MQQKSIQSTNITSTSKLPQENISFSPQEDSSILVDVDTPSSPSNTPNSSNYGPRSTGIKLGEVHKNKPPEYHPSFIFTHGSTISMARLMNKCRSTNAPLYLLDDIMSMIKNEITENDFNIVDAPLSKTVLKNLGQQFTVVPPTFDILTLYTKKT